jgi:hypothetical protein
MLLLDGFGFDFGGMGDFFGSLLANIVQFLLQILQFIWNVLVYVANYIWAALNWLGNFFYTLFQDVAKAFKWIWEKVIKLGLTKLVTLIQKVRTWLSNTLRPILDFIKKVRKWYDDFFNRWIKPVLKMIQTMRKVLTIFRLLGFKWAKRLDADLAMVEQRIVKYYSELRKYINDAITWIDLIIDPTGILRRNPLFAALLHSQNEVRNMVLQAPARPLLGSETDAQTRDRNQATPATQKDNFTTYYAQGQLTPDDDAARKQFAAAWDALRAGSGDYSV